MRYGLGHIYRHIFFIFGLLCLYIFGVSLFRVLVLPYLWYFIALGTVSLLNNQCISLPFEVWAKCSSQQSMLKLFWIFLKRPATNASEASISPLSYFEYWTSCEFVRPVDDWLVSSLQPSTTPAPIYIENGRRVSLYTLRKLDTRGIESWSIRVLWIFHAIRSKW